MPDSPDKKIPDDLVAEVEAQSPDTRRWVLENFAGMQGPSYESPINQIRHGVKRMLQVSELYERLASLRSIGQFNDFVRRDLTFLKQYNQGLQISHFPDQEKIITQALIRCLHGAMTDPDRSGNGSDAVDWIKNAVALKKTLNTLGIVIPKETPDFDEAWKTAFTHVLPFNSNLAIEVAECIKGDIDLREIPNYEDRIKAAYYDLSVSCGDREDGKLRAALGSNIEFLEQDQIVVAKMGEYLANVHQNRKSIQQITHLLKKFPSVRYYPDSIPHFEKGVRAAFLESLKDGSLGVECAKLIQSRLAGDVDLSSEVVEAITYKLNAFENHGEYVINQAIEIKNAFEVTQSLSQNAEYQRALVSLCIKLLTESPYYVTYTAKVKEDLGEGVDFSETTVQGYNSAVQKTLCRKIATAELDEAEALRDNFGAGVDLRPDSVERYNEALEYGLKQCLSSRRFNDARKLMTDFGVEAEIDVPTIVRGQFIKALETGTWGVARDIKKNFEPDIACDREHIAGYDEAFLGCFEWSIKFDTEPRKLCEALGAGVDITPALARVKESDPLKFIAIASKEEWRGVFGAAEIDSFLKALPSETNEKRNAFTHNAYDRTTQLIESFVRGKTIALTSEDFSVLTEYVGRFGLCKSHILFNCFREVRSGIPYEGIANLDDLENRIAHLRAQVYGQEPVYDLTHLSPIEVELLSFVTGKSSHRFDGGRPQISQIINDFKVSHDKDEIASTPDAYTAEEIEASEASLEFDPETVREDFLTLKKEMMEGVENPEDITGLVAASTRIMDGKIESLREKGTSGPIAAQIEKAESAKKRIAEAQDIDELMVALVDTRFLGNKNPLYSVMRQVVFRKIFLQKKSPQMLEDMLARLGGNEITAQKVLEIIGIVDEMIKNHVLNLDKNNVEKYWSTATWNVLRKTKNDKSLVDVMGIFSPYIGNLKAAAKEFKLHDTGEKKMVRAIPDRGFVGEMSAYLADVCYSAEYPLLKPRPNLVPHKLVVGEGKDVQFFGSYLTFELEEDTGEKVMLLRGFNVPQEGTIDIVTFIEETLDRLEATARARGITKIVVPGNTGAMSNYPLTINYLLNKYVNKKTAIRLKEEFRFNGYDLTENCFVARIVKQEKSQATVEKPATELHAPQNAPEARSA